MDKLLKEYYKIFPNARFSAEWFDLPNELKYDALKEAVEDKKDISQTKIFKIYVEKVTDAD